MVDGNLQKPGYYCKMGQVCIGVVGCLWRRMGTEVCKPEAGGCIGWTEVHTEEKREQNTAGDGIEELGNFVEEPGIVVEMGLGIDFEEPGTEVDIAVGVQNGELEPHIEVEVDIVVGV
jgi:hypothetical protein